MPRNNTLMRNWYKSKKGEALPPPDPRSGDLGTRGQKKYSCGQPNANQRAIQKEGKAQGSRREQAGENLGRGEPRPQRGVPSYELPIFQLVI